MSIYLHFSIFFVVRAKWGKLFFCLVNSTKWQIRDNKTEQRVLTEHLEIVIIKILEQYDYTQKNGENKICQWMLFLNVPNEREVSKIMDKNDDIEKIIQELKRKAELSEKSLIHYNMLNLKIQLFYKSLL